MASGSSAKPQLHLLEHFALTAIFTFVVIMLVYILPQL